MGNEVPSSAGICLVPQTGATVAELMKDPELMAKVQKQIAANLGGAAAVA